MTFRLAAGVILFFSALTASVLAQLQQGTIAGTIVGPDNSPIGQAQVTLFDQLGTPVTTVEARDGAFRIADVPVGSYSLKAIAPPFEAVVESLTVADARPVSLQLRLSASLEEQVNVTAETDSARHRHDPDDARWRRGAPRPDTDSQPRIAGCDCDDARMGDRRQRVTPCARR